LPASAKPAKFAAEKSSRAVSPSSRPLDIRAIRRRLGQSHAEFAYMIGVSLATLQNWEQGRRRPEGPARALLKVAAVDPEALASALARWRKGCLTL